MSDWLCELWRKLRFIVNRQQFERDLDEELRLHRDLRTQEYQNVGIDQDSAQREAQRRFGNVTLLKEASREMWGWIVFERVAQDLRYALRTMRRSPGFTTVAVMSLALGIGVNTAIFSLINALLLRSLPVTEPERLVRLESGRGAQMFRYAFSYPLYEQVRDHNQVFSSVFAQAERQLQADLAGVVIHLPGSATSGNYFAALGLKPQAGRFFAAEDDRPGGGRYGPVAVISDEFWTSQYGRQPNVIGQAIRLNGVMFTVIGVTPAGFGGITVGLTPKVFVPLTMVPQLDRDPTVLHHKGSWWLISMARLKSGISLEQARAQMRLLSPRIMAEVLPAMPEKDAGEFKKRVISVEAGGSGWTFLRLQFAKPLWVLMVLVGLVLLIACANLANLLLARGAARRKETAVRLAIGAGRARIIRQLLTESLLLATAGGLLGIVFASWTSGLLAAFLSRKGAPVVLDVQPDAQVLAFTVAMVLVTSLLFGLIPAWLAARAGVGPALKGGSHAIQGADRRFGLGRALLVIQVALSVVLVLGSVLFSGSLRNLKSIDPGFQTGHVVLMSMDTDHLAEKDKALTTLYNRILERVQQMPGVRAASVVNVTPLSGYGWSDVAKNPGETPPQEQEVSMNSVGPRYFEATGTPIQSGRDFDSHDRDGAPKVAIINDLAAKRLFPRGNALGGQLQVGTTNPDDVGLVTVIGIVKNAKYLSLRDPAPPTIYIAHTQGGPSSMTFVIRTTGDFGPVVRQFQSLAHELAPRAPVPEAVAMEEIVDDSLGTERLIASLSAFFGVLALLLTCIGLYGVLAYTVARRTGEIGIRMALGAQGRDVFWLVTRETGVLVAAGLAAGLAGALAIGRLVTNMLYGLTATDPWIITVVVMIIVIAAFIAGFLPTHRASRVDPMAALRYE